MSNVNSKSPLASVVRTKVKWYSPQKGFGFLSSDNIQEDIFLHFSVLDHSGYRHLNEGDVLLCELGEGKKGLQVTKIVGIEPAESAPAADASPAGHSNNDDDTIELLGTVRWFNPVKGFGFVAADDNGKDVFLHISVLRRLRQDSINQGKRLRMHVFNSPRGREARTIEMI